ncbi:MAG: hypothetical protein M0R51_05295 [Clostridia bacterium]|jgi:hypothetical protein|nr:hypothetical protein [Clostridia bacterium]
MRQQQNVDIERVSQRLAEKILAYREEIKLIPIQSEALCLSEAADLCSMGLTGSMVSNLLTLQEQGDKRDLVDFLDKHMSKIIAFCMIVGVIVLGIYILSTQTGAV